MRKQVNLIIEGLSNSREYLGISESSYRIDKVKDFIKYLSREDQFKITELIDTIYSTLDNLNVEYRVGNKVTKKKLTKDYQDDLWEWEKLSQLSWDIELTLPSTSDGMWIDREFTTCVNAISDDLYDGQPTIAVDSGKTEIRGVRLDSEVGGVAYSRTYGKNTYKFTTDNNYFTKKISIVVIAPTNSIS